jgi:hypothetical protein
MRSPKGNELPIKALFLTRTKRADMIRKNQPGNFASINSSPINPSTILNPTAIIVNTVNNAITGTDDNRNAKATAAIRIDVNRKLKPNIIFFFKKGVVSFRNLVLPSTSPVSKARIRKNGRADEITWIVQCKLPLI